MKSTQGPIDVFLCPEDSSGVCSPVKSPFKAPAEELSPGSSQQRASPLLHPAQDVNMLLAGEQDGDGNGMRAVPRLWRGDTVMTRSMSEKGCMKHRTELLAVC